MSFNYLTGLLDIISFTGFVGEVSLVDAWLALLSFSILFSDGLLSMLSVKVGIDDYET
tara:strand:+ start:628 stop:801 length:174 start_codon:yes stop_codon:yes gene_type:complete